MRGQYIYFGEKESVMSLFIGQAVVGKDRLEKEIPESQALLTRRSSEVCLKQQQGRKIDIGSDGKRGKREGKEGR